MTAIVLADDHAVVRRGIRMLLEAEKDFRVVGEASDNMEAVRLVEALSPDVLVTDLSMNGLTGFDVIRKTKQRSPETRVVVLSMHNNPAYVVQALQSGAKGYVLKEASPDELTRAIRAVLSGESYLSPPLSEEMVDSYRRRIETDR